MKYAWMDEYLMNKTGVTKDLKEEWNWIRYMIGGKMFAAINETAAAAAVKKAVNLFIPFTSHYLYAKTGQNIIRLLRPRRRLSFC